jgi:hypothetical protein
MRPDNNPAGGGRGPEETETHARTGMLTYGQGRVGVSSSSFAVPAVELGGDAVLIAASISGTTMTGEKDSEGEEKKAQVQMDLITVLPSHFDRVYDVLLYTFAPAATLAAASPAISPSSSSALSSSSSSTSAQTQRTMLAGTDSSLSAPLSAHARSTPKP